MCYTAHSLQTLQVLLQTHFLYQKPHPTTTTVAAAAAASGTTNSNNENNIYYTNREWVYEPEWTGFQYGSLVDYVNT